MRKQTLISAGGKKILSSQSNRDSQMRPVKMALKVEKKRDGKLGKPESRKQLAAILIGKAGFESSKIAEIRRPGF
jgi:hypothetical protein